MKKMKNALKNSIKKIAAIGGSAVMLGATMLGALAVADFSTVTDKAGASEFYTTNGELNAMVMLGTLGTDVLGTVTDLAGAIDVAAAMAQKATLGGESGGALVAKNVTPGYLDTSGGSSTEAVEYGTAVSTATFSSSTTGFDWLRNVTVVYNDTPYYLEEMITVLGTTSQLDNTGKFYFRQGGQIIFNISANTTLPLNFDQFMLKDQTYQIVAFQNDTTDPSVNGTIELGQLQRVAGINVGDFVDIGATTIKLKLTGIKQTFTAWKAVFDIYDTSVSETTPVVTNVEKAPGDTAYSNDTLGIKFSVYTMYKDASDIWNVDIDWTEAAITLIQDFETSIFDDHTAKIGFDTDQGILWVAFLAPGGSSPSAWWPQISAGESVDLMESSDGWFKLAYESDRIGADTTEDEGEENPISVFSSIGSGFEVTYKDNNTDDTGFDLSNYLEMEAAVYPNIAGTTFQPTLDHAYYVSYYNNAGTHSVIFQRAVGQQMENVSIVADGGHFYNTSLAGDFWYNVSVSATQINVSLWNFTSNGSYFQTNLTYLMSTGDTGLLQLYDPKGERIYIKYNTTTGEAIGTNPLYYDKISGTDPTFSTTSTSQYTRYGTLIAPSTDVFTLLYPQMQRVAKIYVGRTAETTETVGIGEMISDTGWVLKSGGGESPVWIFAGPTANGIAALDSDSVTKPVVLIGGPGANAKVSSLMADGKALQMNGTDLTPAANTAYVELVEDAFGTYDAVVIAGTGAADTRMACKVFASQILYGTPLTNFEGTKLKFNTGVGTFTDVTAEAYT